MANGWCAYTTIFLLFLLFCHFSPASSDESDGMGEKRRLKIIISNPTLGWSHSQFLGRIADELIQAGHEVHFLIFDLNTKVGNYTGSQLVTKIYRPKTAAKIDINDLQLSNFDGQNEMPDMFTMFNRMLTSACQDILSDSALLARLNSERYDLSISEYYFVCINGIFHHLGIQTKIAASALALSNENVLPFGMPVFSSFNFNLFTRCANKRTGELTFWERAYNMKLEHKWQRATSSSNAEQQKIFTAKFGNDFPQLAEINRNQSLLLVNSNEFFSLPRSITPKVVFIGGIVKTTKSDSALDLNFKQIFDKSQSGVILFSFGTFFDHSTFTPEARDIFLQAFRRFPTYDVIWKLDVDERNATSTDVPSNVHIFKWIDQKAILAHPRTRLFITHCGMNSANEVAAAGVPVVAIPIFSDQFHNSAILGRKRVGVVFDVVNLKLAKEIGASRLVSAIEKVLADPSFAENAKLLSRKISSAPFSPAERLVKWVEFAAQFPDLNELNLPLVEEMGWWRYYNVDVLVTVALVVLAGLALAVLLAKVAWNALLAALQQTTMSDGRGNRKKRN